MKTKTSQQQERDAVAELIRVSTVAQTAEDKAGLLAQRDACKRIAKTHDLDVRWSYQLDAISGAAVQKSPKMQELLKLIRTGTCKGIVMKEESRLMRPDAFGDLKILEEIEKNQVRLYLLDTVIDFSTPSGKLFAFMKFGFAGYERSIIRERLVGGKNAKRDRGEWHCGRNTVSIGLKVVREGNRNVLRIDPKTIGRVKRLFEMFISGQTSFSVLSKETGIRYTSVKDVLTNPIYTGYHEPKKKVRQDGTVYREDGTIRYQKRKAIPVGERIRIKMLEEEPPITEAVFRQAQKLLTLKRSMAVRFRQTPDKDPFLYRGFLRCAECGERLITVSYSNKPQNFFAEYYVCQAAHGARKPNGTWKIKNGTCKTRRMRREMLEPVLDDLIVQRFANPKFLVDLVAAQADESEDDAAVQVERLNLEIEEARRSLERNQDLYIRGKIDIVKFDRMNSELETELRASQIALGKIRPNLDKISPEMWKPLARQFKMWKTYKPARKRALLSAIAPIFQAAGYAGKKYHETIVKVKGFRLNLTGATEESSDLIAGDDEIAMSGLVHSTDRSYSVPDINQSPIYVTL
jgi:DNA invertase Pin-like site-specific DNA recombinase